MEWCTVFKFVRSCFPWTEEWIIWVSYSFYSLSSPQTKLKSMKKHRAWTTALTSCELTAIIYNFLGPLQSNRDFRAPLAWAIRWYPGFNHWPLPSSRTRRVKNLTDFFKCVVIYPMYLLYTEKYVHCIALLCSGFADPVTFANEWE